MIRVRITKWIRGGAIGVALTSGLAICSVGVLAQDHAPPAGTVEIFGRGPVPLDLPEPNLARPVRHVSQNGFTTLVVPDTGVGLVTARLVFDTAGALYEPEHLAGIASVTADLFLEATTTMTGRELVDGFRQLGATFSVDAPVGSPETVVEVTGLSRNMGDWLPMTFDVVRNPAFPERRLNSLISSRLSGLALQETSFGATLESTFYSLLYNGHPASRRSATAESLEAISLESVRQWHRERFVPANATLTVVGDVGLTRLTELVDRQVEGWMGEATAGNLPPLPDPDAARQILLADRPSALQVGVSLGNRAVSRDHPDYVPLRVANEILGSTGLDQGDYVRYNQFAASRFDRHWGLVAATGTASLAATLDGLFEEIRRLQSGSVSAGNLDGAKRALITSFALSLEDRLSRATYAGLSESYELEDGYWNAYISRVAAVSSSDVQRVARTYLNLDTILIAVVGDAAAVQPVLEAYGPVRLVTGPAPE